MDADQTSIATMGCVPATLVSLVLIVTSAPAPMTAVDTGTASMARATAVLAGLVMTAPSKSATTTAQDTVNVWMASARVNHHLWGLTARF